VSGQPVYRLLGGAKDRIPAYASTLTLDSIKEFLDLADSCLARGYKAIKLHAWGRVQQDAELFRALRKHVGDDIVLMYDASSMFDYEDALWLGHVLEDLNYYWYEEPMDHHNLTALARLADALTIPLAVAEATVGGPYNALDHIMAGAADIIITDPIIKMKGGFTGVMKTAHICEAFGMQCAIHGWQIPSLHVACAIQNCRYFESLQPEGFFIPPGTHIASTEIDKDGYVRPWDKAGLGMEIDWKWIESHSARIIE
jgi:L-alanine-DL-glutamate epimerase-like enolase superfamily enzyme